MTASRRFDIPTYLTGSAGWNVEKLVNVAAATGRHSIDETLELDRRADADGHPDGAAATDASNMKSAPRRLVNDRIC